MDEKATSSSRKGAMPVHSELRQPRKSSSSASWRSSCALTRLLQLYLERIAVHAAVVPVEDVGDVGLAHLLDGLARNDPERERLAAPPVELPRVCLGEHEVGRFERATVLEGLAFALLPEDFVDHAASTNTVRRTHAVSSREALRKPSRRSVSGPWPVTTHLSSSQSGSE